MSTLSYVNLNDKERAELTLEETDSARWLSRKQQMEGTLSPVERCELRRLLTKAQVAASTKANFARAERVRRATERFMGSQS